MPVPVVVDKNLHQAAYAVQVSIASLATDQMLLNANPARKGLFIYNDSTAILYILFDSTLSGGEPTISSTTKYSVQVASQQLFELPGPAIYTGIVKGIWASANGNARITELS